ncbi:Asp-tRNA(Asn)/Glu-tRNA(Gln) amidotransferase subunit GatB [Bradymonas sediminis]|uniref:Aspartyl/glutamyl-tRNA(Asn/Gln) amidotransferase subunit B n=1 Tax=Bradymonas sediminis TaxID=1548548 RepID=A0A2Z4FLI3_9DELT|nr:Asp-tRNA(Asn)/Glu-tRNA(Gln) amidotransferase subunit GatB [Bradymonas sediminis]AWV89839.1 Asp-tRNA(Asn)/Glu-tRNA(Gln) amidotransferase GatCAB subunit B [Bradymonas sediminis]TDP76412.1 aspartyl/glutamyl-tRNA(Asn/Gln) amidotransferase subunit B [Bradymonas sediminis]
MSQKISEEIRQRYEVVIGLEVHVQLRTETKIFSGASAAYGAAPNTQVSPLDLGLPGVLPVLNMRAVEFAMKAGFALNCEVREWSRFARKNYFYPDMPKGYQITQFEHPICEFGHLEVAVDPAGLAPGADAPQGAEATKKVRILRIHMEEDAGKSTHVEGQPYSLVDLNRAGVPLIEIVSEPDIRSASEAVDYLKKLRNIVVYLGISDGNMQEGSFRCDANVSVRPWGQEALGTRSELKNINSFKFVHDAIDFEVNRQIAMLESGEKVVQETRLYNPDKGETFSMRSKEESHDYRYFPEPDLPPLVIDSAWMERVKTTLPELPEARRARYLGELGLSEYDAGVLTDDFLLSEYFNEAVAACPKDAKPSLYKSVANWIINELLARLDGETGLADVKVRPPQLARLVQLIDEDAISGKIGKKVFDEMLASGAEPDAIIEAKGLKQISDSGALGEIIDQLIAENPEPVADYRAGNNNIVGWFVGQVMKATRGQANPKVVNKLLVEKLRGDA